MDFLRLCNGMILGKIAHKAFLQDKLAGLALNRAIDLSKQRITGTYRRGKSIKDGGSVTLQILTCNTRIVAR